MSATPTEQQHLEKLAAAFFEELIMLEWEYGAPGLDPKRPFGNSDVESDILELLDIKPEGDDGEAECFSSKQRAYAEDLYRVKLIPFLQKAWAERNAAAQPEAAPATGQIPVQPNYSAIAALQADLALDAAARIAELQTKLNAWIAAATETGTLLPDAAGMPRATVSTVPFQSQIAALKAGSVPITCEKLAELISEGWAAGFKHCMETKASEPPAPAPSQPTST